MTIRGAGNGSLVPLSSGVVSNPSKQRASRTGNRHNRKAAEISNQLNRKDL
uniref:Uncharacterized protein n=1 Tax=Physcomitrium patens TaxID=3218 RepID=A0A2K1IRX2_PHYPA|nr:hypothetical protein PHYPA_026156 [Physcomitrium patens]